MEILKVTAGQHMQLSGDLKPGVSVAAQQGMYFSQQQATPAPSGSGPAPGDTYTVSQSQTINFTQQSLRQRPGGAGGRPGVDVTVGSRQAMEQQHKLIQQQQMLRAQQQVLQQQSHMAGMGPRPPPPEYKANPQLMLMAQQQQQQRFTTGNMRRVGQQPMPPSGPMMRPQQQQQTLHGGGGSMYIGGPAGIVQHQHRMAGTYVTPGGRNNQRPPNVSIGPDGINIGGRGGGAEWRHLLMSQQQNAVFGTQMRPTFTQGGHQGSFGMGSGQGGVQLSAAQQMQHQQLVRNQALSGSPVSQMQMISQQQSLGLHSAPVPTNATQMSMSLQMSQSMSVSGGGGGSPHHHAHHPHHSQQPAAPQQQQPIVSYGGSPVGAGAGNTGPPPQHQQHPPPTSSSTAPVSSAQQSVSQPPPPTPDFSLEFLEHLPTGDSSHFSAAAQELLNSLDSTSAFNLDIL